MLSRPLSARSGHSVRSTSDHERALASVSRRSKVASQILVAVKTSTQIVSRADGQSRFSRLSEDDFTETAMVVCKADREMY